MEPYFQLISEETYVIPCVWGARVIPVLISFYALNFLIYLKYLFKAVSFFFFFWKNKLNSEIENRSNQKLLTEQDTVLGKVAP